jgi:hypothetical protein
MGRAKGVAKAALTARSGLGYADGDTTAKGGVMQEYQLYVGGEFCAAKSGKAIDSINPATEEPWAASPAP